MSHTLGENEWMEGYPKKKKKAWFWYLRNWYPGTCGEGNPRMKVILHPHSNCTCRDLPFKCIFWWWYLFYSELMTSSWGDLLIVTPFQAFPCPGQSLVGLGELMSICMDSTNAGPLPSDRVFSGLGVGSRNLLRCALEYYLVAKIFTKDLWGENGTAIEITWTSTSSSQPPFNRIAFTAMVLRLSVPDTPLSLAARGLIVRCCRGRVVR